MSGLLLLGYTIYSWNDFSDRSFLTMQNLMVSMFIFGGIDKLLNKQRILKFMGLLYFAVAIFIACVSISKYS
jgi:hypothetical protein